MPVAGPAGPRLRLPGSGPRRAGPVRGHTGLHRCPSPGRRRPASHPAHPGPGRDRRIREGQDRRTVPAGQAVPRPRRRDHHLEGRLRLPAHPPQRGHRASAPGDLRTRGRRGAADLHRPGRRHHRARDLPPTQRRRGCRHRPAKPTWGTLHPAAGCCATRPTSAGSTTTAPNRCPTGAPPAAHRQVPRDRDEWIPIDCPRIVSDELFEAAGTGRHRQQPSGARAAPNPAQWLLKGLVKCGVCGVGTNCHKMRGRNGTWHRYYYCRNHDPHPRRRRRPPLPRTQHPRRRPRRVRVRPHPRRAHPARTCCWPANKPSR